MELRHFRYFVAVAEERNFTRAAERLGIQQPPLSKQIADLERELGARLFERVPQGAEPTQAGKALLVEVYRVFAAVDRAILVVAQAHRGETGSLSIGFTASAAFNPMVNGSVRAFRSKWPTVELSLSEVNSEALLASVLVGDIDAAFVRPTENQPAGIHFRALPDEPTLVALPEGHPLARHERVRLDQLRDEPFILFPRAIGPSLYDEIRSACRTAGIEPRIIQQAPQIASTLSLVGTGLGVSVVPASMARIQMEGVALRAITGEAPVARLSMAYRSGAIPTVLENFLKELGRLQE